MTRKAWIENNQIRDICPGNPNELYVEEVAQYYTTDVPETADNGDGWVNGQLTKRPIPDIQVQPKTISVDQIRQNLTLSEKVKWDANKIDEIVTAKQEFTSPLEVTQATEVLQFLVDAGVISQASMSKVLA